MMAMTNRFRCLIPLALAVLILALVVIGLLVPWWNKIAYYDEAAEAAADRIGRYQKLIRQQPAYRTALQQLRQEHEKQGYFLVGASQELAAAELQKKVKEVVGQAGGTLVSTHSASVSSGLLGKVQLKVRMKGDTGALSKVLYDLESQHPLLFVENLNIRSRKAVKGRRQNRVTTYSLDVSFDLTGYMPGGSR